MLPSHPSHLRVAPQSCPWGPLGPEARLLGRAARAGDAPVDDCPRAAERRAGSVGGVPREAEDAHLAEAVDAGMDGVRVVVAAVRESTGCEDGRRGSHRSDHHAPRHVTHSLTFPFAVRVLNPFQAPANKSTRSATASPTRRASTGTTGAPASSTSDFDSVDGLGRGDDVAPARPAPAPSRAGRSSVSTSRTCTRVPGSDSADGIVAVAAARV